MIVGRRDDNQMEACLSRSNNISDLGVCSVARLQDLSCSSPLMVHLHDKTGNDVTLEDFIS